MEEFIEDDDDLSALEETFNKAAQHLKSLVDNLDSKELLFLYSHYKQATAGNCNTKRPGLFDIKGRQKWDVWKKLRDMGSEQAMTEYVDRIDELDPSWRNTNSKAGLGIGVSTLYREGDEGDLRIKDTDKTVFDWCKDGNTQKVEVCLSSPKFNINDFDDMGLGLIHWACDRGHPQLIDILAKFHADINLQDTSGLTPLHYAVICEHVSVVERLLKYGADPTLRDNENVLPSQGTDDPHILQLLATRIA